MMNRFAGFSGPHINATKSSTVLHGSVHGCAFLAPEAESGAESHGIVLESRFQN